MPSPAARPDRSAEPPLVIGTGPRWVIVWLSAVQAGNGDWHYGYSIAPGRIVTVTVRPAPDMLPPYDPTFADVLRPIIDVYPASAG